MRNIKLTVAYDGSRYNGWQRQKNSPNTIQELMEGVVFDCIKEKVTIISSGRTDAGVHAYGQVINFNINSTLPLNEIQRVINITLPNDIAVKNIEEVGERFHSRYNAKSKIYTYKILNSNVHDPFLRKYSCYCPHELDIEKMKKASKLLIGQHNFNGFSSAKNTKKSTERIIYSIDFERKGELINISFHGNGFLYNMVRIITGTLIEIGLSKISEDAIKTVLKSGERHIVGYTAPPQGLFLVEVKY